MYAMAGSGEWIDVQGMRVEKNSGVHAVRYREAADDGIAPGRDHAKAARALVREDGRDARRDRSRRRSADVEEASRAARPAVVSTWLIEADKVSIEKPAPLNGEELVQLADNGVPASVIDVMVGLSYPDVFAVNPDERWSGATESDSAYARYGYLELDGRRSNPIIGFDRFGFRSTRPSPR